jgi:hypothetical protein
MRGNSKKEVDDLRDKSDSVTEEDKERVIIKVMENLLRTKIWNKSRAAVLICAGCGD